MARDEETEAQRLLLEIARCPVVDDYFAKVSRNAAPTTCAEIIAYQREHFDATERDRYQLPEPWRGNIRSASLLFVSSNPSIGHAAHDEHPRWNWRDEEVVDFYEKCFDRDVVDGAYIPRIHPETGQRIRGQRVPFWAGILNLSRELIGLAVRPGRDYALTEVVRCKSRSEVGVWDAVSPCAGRYLRRTIALSAARVIVVLGVKARSAFSAAFEELRVESVGENAPFGSVRGPIYIAGATRYVVFMPHPNARMKRTFSALLSEAQIAALTRYLVVS